MRLRDLPGLRHCVIPVSVGLVGTEHFMMFIYPYLVVKHYLSDWCKPQTPYHAQVGADPRWTLCPCQALWKGGQIESRLGAGERLRTTYVTLMQKRNADAEQRSSVSVSNRSNAQFWFLNDECEASDGSSHHKSNLLSIVYIYVCMCVVKPSINRIHICVHVCSQAFYQ